MLDAIDAKCRVVVIEDCKDSLLRLAEYIRRRLAGIAYISSDGIAQERMSKCTSIEKKNELTK